MNGGDVREDFQMKRNTEKLVLNMTSRRQNTLKVVLHVLNLCAANMA